MMGEIMEVRHVLQQEEWDCGLACARMIFRYCNISLGEEDTKLISACKELGINKAVWTIDLAHLMSKFNIKHDFYTITFGVDPKYTSVEFYNSNTFEFSDEEARINRLFQEAKDRGITASKKSLDREEIISHLREGHPAIVLIDANILHCQMCKSSKQQECLPLGCCTKDGEEERGYIGHFVVACGYHLEKEQVFYKNPGRPVDLCCCSFENFDAARKSHGTDEDILFIQR